MKKMKTKMRSKKKMNMKLKLNSKLNLFVFVFFSSLLLGLHPFGSFNISWSGPPVLLSFCLSILQISLPFISSSSPYLSPPFLHCGIYPFPPTPCSLLPAPFSLHYSLLSLYFTHCFLTYPYLYLHLYLHILHTYIAWICYQSRDRLL